MWNTVKVPSVPRVPKVPVFRITVDVQSCLKFNFTAMQSFDQSEVVVLEPVELQLEALQVPVDLFLAEVRPRR